MIRELSILALALALPLGSAASAQQPTAPPGPLGLVESSVSRALEIVQSSAAGSEARRTALVRVSHELFDFDGIARRALGLHWKGASPLQQAEFVRLFTDVLERALLTSVMGYTAENVSFTGEAIDGDWARVHSRITPNKGDAVAIEYRLHAARGRWIVYDVAWEHVSLVASYRSQFNAIVRAASVAQLLERMQTEQLRRRDARIPASLAPDRFAAGLLLAVLTRPGAQSWPSPASHGSSPQMEVRR